jgi:hypothetical protein
LQAKGVARGISTAHLIILYQYRFFKYQSQEPLVNKSADQHKYWSIIRSCKSTESSRPGRFPTSIPVSAPQSCPNQTRKHTFHLRKYGVIPGPTLGRLIARNLSLLNVRFRHSSTISCLLGGPTEIMLQVRAISSLYHNLSYRVAPVGVPHVWNCSPAFTMRFKVPSCVFPENDMT